LRQPDKACVRELDRLLEKFISRAYGVEKASAPGTDGGIAGVHVIPRSGEVSNPGLGVTNERLHRAAGQLEREVWELVERYEKILVRGTEHGYRDAQDYEQ
jgi:hypothetical protein